MSHIFTVRKRLLQIYTVSISLTLIKFVTMFIFNSKLKINVLKKAFNAILL